MKGQIFRTKFFVLICLFPQEVAVSNGSFVINFGTSEIARDRGKAIKWGVTSRKH